MSTESLMGRIAVKQEWLVARGIVEPFLTAADALVGIPDHDAALYDAGKALDQFIDALGNEASRSLGDAADQAFGARPATSDTRPLYQRIESYGDAVARPFRSALGKLQLTAMFIEDEALYNEYYDALVALHDAFGIPTAAERSSNPGAHPTVKPLLDTIKDSLALSADVESAFENIREAS